MSNNSNKIFISNDKCEIRILENGDLLIKGFLPTNELSEVLFSKERRSFFKERIISGAFKDVLDEQKKSPLLLINHNYDKNLKVRDFTYYEDKRGLNFTYTIEPTEELISNLSKITSLSFGFVCKSDYWVEVKNQDKNYNYVRVITSFDHIKEISILLDVEPAYAKTRVYCGSNKKEIDEIQLREFITHMKGVIKELRGKHIKEIKDFIAKHRKTEGDYMRSFIDSRR